MENVFEPAELKFFFNLEKQEWMVTGKVDRYNLSGVGKTIVSALASLDEDFNKRLAMSSKPMNS